MIRSMTGFGDASGRDGGGVEGNGSSAGVEYFVEVRSVNAKYFKAVLRLPEEIQALEPEIEAVVRKRLDRGSDTTAAAAMEVKYRAFDNYSSQMMASDAVSGGKVGLDAGSLLQLPGVLQAPGGEEERLNRARAAVLPLVERACDAAVAMRAEEGVALSEDLLGQLAVMAENLEKIEEKAPDVVRSYEERLQSRIERLLETAGASIDQVDLVREIAVYAEKTDIAEEIQRLRGHIEHFRTRLSEAKGEPVGRTLDFLSQEMLREANTIASKSPDALISSLVVEIKGAIDRVKEQVQNCA